MGRITMVNFGKTVLLSSLFLAGLALSAQQPKRTPPAPRSVRTALGCLVARDYIQDDLQELKLGPGRSAWIRYYIGTIPGTSPTPGELYIAVYSEDGKHGWLLLSFPDSEGKSISVRNAYRLTKVGPRWEADEGNGGLGTYRAMSAFATRLARSKRYRVKLLPRTQGCAAPDQ